MDLLHPRPAYHRVNTEGPVAYGDSYELASIYSHSELKQDTKQDHLTLQDYSSDYLHSDT